MTKVGEEGLTPREPTIQQYRRELDTSSLKFLNALSSYNNAADAEEKVRLKAIMDQQLGIIRAAVNELKRSGIHKQEVKVEHDYQAYLREATPETYTVLEQDLSTLREYNQMP